MSSSSPGSSPRDLRGRAKPAGISGFVRVVFRRLVRSSRSCVFRWRGRAAQVKIALATALVIIAYPSLMLNCRPTGLHSGFGAVGFIGLIAKEAFVGLRWVSCGRLYSKPSGCRETRRFSAGVDDERAVLTELRKCFRARPVQHPACDRHLPDHRRHMAFIGTLVTSYEFIPALNSEY